MTRQIVSFKKDFEQVLNLRNSKDHIDHLTQEEIDCFKIKIIPKLEEIITWYGRYPAPKIKNLKQPYLQEIFRVGMNVGAVTLNHEDILLIKKVFFYFENQNISCIFK